MSIPGQNTHSNTGTTDPPSDTMTALYGHECGARKRDRYTHTNTIHIHTWGQAFQPNSQEYHVPPSRLPRW